MYVRFSEMMLALAYTETDTEKILMWGIKIFQLLTDAADAEAGRAISLRGAALGGALGGGEAGPGEGRGIKDIIKNIINIFCKRNVESTG